MFGKKDRTLKSIIDQCAETTLAKGFNTSQHATQIALIATEVAEAIECLEASPHFTTPSEVATNNYCRMLISESNRYEAIRKTSTSHEDHSVVTDQQHLNEELADIVIRVFSYVGGNGQMDNFIEELMRKMDINKCRPKLHGKAF